MSNLYLGRCLGWFLASSVGAFMFTWTAFPKAEMEALSISPSEFDLTGELILVGSHINLETTLAATSATPVELVGILASCNCISVSSAQFDLLNDLPIVIQPKTSMPIGITLETDGKLGNLEQKLSFQYRTLGSDALLERVISVHGKISTPMVACPPHFSISDNEIKYIDLCDNVDSPLFSIVSVDSSDKSIAAQFLPAVSDQPINFGGHRLNLRGRIAVQLLGESQSGSRQEKIRVILESNANHLTETLVIPVSVSRCRTVQLFPPVLNVAAGGAVVHRRIDVFVKKPSEEVEQSLSILSATSEVCTVAEVGKANTGGNSGEDRYFVEVHLKPGKGKIVLLVAGEALEIPVSYEVLK